jgi:hypothetical protein
MTSIRTDDQVRIKAAVTSIVLILAAGAGCMRATAPTSPAVAVAPSIAPAPPPVASTPPAMAPTAPSPETDVTPPTAPPAVDLVPPADAVPPVGDAPTSDPRAAPVPSRAAAPSPSAEQRATPRPSPPRVVTSPPAQSPKKPEAPVKVAPPASLDFASLGARLRATKAIGVLTKLSLKNQIDDLLHEFKLFHEGRGPALSTLRERYDLLLMKVLSLLQNDDTGLASDVSASREAIWAILVDPAKFARIN